MSERFFGASQIALGAGLLVIAVSTPRPAAHLFIALCGICVIVCGALGLWRTK